VLAELRAYESPSDSVLTAGAVLRVIGAGGIGPLIGALGSPLTRPMAATVLGALREADAAPALVTILNASDPVGRPEAARALGEIKDPRTVEALLVATGDPDFAVRDAAARALDSIGTIAAVLGVAAVLRPALSDGRMPPLAELVAAIGTAPGAPAEAAGPNGQHASLEEGAGSPLDEAT
jgi:HEAT repeat protein